MSLAIGAANSLPDQPNPAPHAALELVCRDYGNASIRRDYAVSSPRVSGYCGRIWITVAGNLLRRLADRGGPA